MRMEMKMTNEEAIKRINNRRFTVSMCIDSNDAIKENIAIDMAVEALEKQIPKKPIYRLFHFASGLDGNVGCCPCCDEGKKQGLMFGSKFCKYCGQAIDWSGEN